MLTKIVVLVVVVGGSPSRMWGLKRAAEAWGSIWFFSKVFPGFSTVF